MMKRLFFHQQQHQAVFTGVLKLCFTQEPWAATHITNPKCQTKWQIACPDPKTHVQTICITPVTTRLHSSSRQRIADRKSRNAFPCLKVLHDNHTTKSHTLMLCGTTFGFVYSPHSPWHHLNELTSHRLFPRGAAVVAFVSRRCMDGGGVTLLHKARPSKSQWFSGRLSQDVVLTNVHLWNLTFTISAPRTPGIVIPTTTYPKVWGRYPTVVLKH